MKKRFISKKPKKKKFKLKFLLFIFLFILSITETFKYLENQKTKLNDKTFIEYLLNNYTINNKKLDTQEKIVKKIFNILTNIDYIDPSSIIDSNYKGLTQKKVVKNQVEKTTTNNKIPIIYIYNSHQTEEYANTTFAEYSINPTVMMADYILQDVFNKNNLYTTVEENSIKEVLNNNNWNYASSYKASRILMENAKSQNPKLEYFIDVHRDSLSKDKTTVQINNKSYAKSIFLIGLENENYQENLNFTEKINNKMNELYPNLSKGIYKKGGPGVNGVYNQDFSKHTILIEIGGKDNTVDEVLNTTLAFCDCFMEVIKENEG